MINRLLYDLLVSAQEYLDAVDDWKVRKGFWAIPTAGSPSFQKLKAAIAKVAGETS